VVVLGVSQTKKGMEERKNKGDIWEMLTWKAIEKREMKA